MFYRDNGCCLAEAEKSAVINKSIASLRWNLLGNISSESEHRNCGLRRTECPLKQAPLFPKLFLVRVFYHSNRIELEHNSYQAPALWLPLWWGSCVLCHHTITSFFYHLRAGASTQELLTNVLSPSCIAMKGSFAFVSPLKPPDQTCLLIWLYMAFDMFPVCVSVKCSSSWYMCSYHTWLKPTLHPFKMVRLWGRHLQMWEDAMGWQQRARRLHEASWPALSIWLIFCSQEPWEMVHAGQ